MDTSCPICLRTIHNLAVLDCCKHMFCKKCIMAWMKRTDSCPLCKLHVGTVITDIITPSHYSQYLPNGKLLYSLYNPNRKAIYTLKLINNPSYEKEVFPNDVPKCSYLKEWITREIESILPGIDSSFFVSMIMEGLNRYGSRDERLKQRITEVIGSYTPTFIRELENCICCQAVSLKEYDSIISYSYPSLAETADYSSDNISLDLNDANELYQNQTRKYNSVEEEMNQLLEACPDIEDKAEQRIHELHKRTWKEKALHTKKIIQDPCTPVDDDDPYADYRDWEVNDY